MVEINKEGVNNAQSTYDEKSRQAHSSSHLNEKSQFCNKNFFNSATLSMYLFDV